MFLYFDNFSFNKSLFYIFIIINCIALYAKSGCPTDYMYEETDVKTHDGSISSTISMEHACRVEYHINSDLTIYNCAETGLLYIPETFPSELNLSVLDLSGNNISAINANAFVELKYLKLLDLSTNKIQRIHKEAFAGLTDLETLILSHNILDCIPDGTLNVLRSLKSLDLSSADLVSLDNSFLRRLNNLIVLKLSNNLIRILPSFGNATGSYVPNLIELHIDNTDISYFNLSYVRRLRILDVGLNNLKELPLYQFKNMDDLELLNLEQCDLTYLHSTTFFGLNKLKILDISSNRLLKFSNSLFHPLTSLEELYADNIGLTEFRRQTYTYMPQLKVLQLQDNNIIHMPNFRLRRGQVAFPNLRVLNYEGNNIDVINQSALNFTNLEELILTKNRFTRIPSDALQPLSNLKRLSLSWNALDCITGTLRSNSLEILDLSSTAASRTKDCVLNFDYLPCLKELDISNSMLDVSRALIRIPTLLRLTANYMDIKSLNDIDLTDTYAIQYLNLSNNNIKEINSEFFISLTDLKTLSLAHNSISVIDSSSLPTSKFLEVIDLAYNPFYCNCSIQWFQHWLKTTKIQVHQLEDSEAYICDSPLKYKDKSVLQIKDYMTLECFEMATRDTTLQIVFILALLFGVLLSSASGLHRYRWHVRYWKYIVTTRRRQQKDLEFSLTLPYDAFIAYSQPDSAWVIHQLMPRLESPGPEGQEALKLCVHQRDWLAGPDIMENVVNSVQSSRKTVLVVSNSFTRSDWCHVEMTLAQSRLYQDERESLVLILLEALDYRYVNTRLRYEMDRRTYIEWPEGSQVGQEMFWLKLRRALERPSVPTVQSDMHKTDSV